MHMIQHTNNSCDRCRIVECGPHIRQFGSSKCQNCRICLRIRQFRRFQSAVCRISSTHSTIPENPETCAFHSVVSSPAARTDRLFYKHLYRESPPKWFWRAFRDRFPENNLPMHAWRGNSVARAAFFPTKPLLAGYSVSPRLSIRASASQMQKNAPPLLCQTELMGGAFNYHSLLLQANSQSSRL